jgi:hypothetical protein
MIALSTSALSAELLPARCARRCFAGIVPLYNTATAVICSLVTNVTNSANVMTVKRRFVQIATASMYVNVATELDAMIVECICIVKEQVAGQIIAASALTPTTSNGAIFARRNTVTNAD